MESANEDLRKICKGNAIPLWQVAKQLGYSESTLYRKWRVPLEGEDRERVIQAIKDLKPNVMFEFYL